MEVSRESISDWLRGLQDSICGELEKADGGAKFQEDKWTRPEGGGGITRIIGDGRDIEKGGVLFSAVSGPAPEFLIKEISHANKPESFGEVKPEFFATGVSIVIHPENPLVPIIHMNVRYFEMNGGFRWLGGGIDLTPHYIDDSDAKFFHSELKKVCDKHHPRYYRDYKEWADNYFFIRHRQECRGIGGIFFDKLGGDKEMSFEKNLSFWKDVGSAFAPIYTELLSRNKNKKFNDRQKQWQLLRRGRYVEFNLIYDRGTKFGLETNGRVESILMSLPKLAGWEYNYIPEKNSDEDRTLQILRKPVDWANS
jgi:coproporphyrinogen III oxidase